MGYANDPSFMFKRSINRLLQPFIADRIHGHARPWPCHPSSLHQSRDFSTRDHCFKLLHLDLAADDHRRALVDAGWFDF
ncbi:hypothetical protein DSM3645_03968 [Blastopirellula marina DSM 3645]|uniref:Uncharacterized protein n=1 Tax=Blastopirellula marina DSM 3645 TaxID=314230 RepID=A3ZV65_9BACT|nr:hypothetical protein DSM3645_03968 [Blastopirellula marina DSM 3645]